MIKRFILYCLLATQLGFVNAEPLLMALAQVEHHHLFENTDFTEQFKTSENHQNFAHHCDVCHGHSSHLAVLVCNNDEPPLIGDQSSSVSYHQHYYSLKLNVIYRPPIALVS